jgi:thiol-disulfide isomerase/thioredoxin
MAAATDWWESEWFVASRAGPVVVQFTTEVCALCPDATLKIDAVLKTHDFVWHIDNAFSSTLAEELEVTALPAILVFHSIDKHKVYQRLRGDDVTRILHAECVPRLVLDEEF